MTRAKSNCLNKAQNFKLCSFVLAEYLREHTTDARFAVRVEKELGFKVSNKQVLDARDAVGVAPWKPRRIEKAPGTTMADRVTKLEAEVEALKRALKDLL
jgi:hypothetical protein